MMYGKGTGDISDCQMGELHYWQGEPGNAYIKRNGISEQDTANLEALWSDILRRVPSADIGRVLEVGANIGRNLIAIERLFGSRLCYGVEPNARARQELEESFPCIEGTVQEIECFDKFFDLVFTSGVLIHVPPEELEKACGEIYRVSRRYIVSIEYFSAQPRMIPYRGEDNKLWSRDFGSFWTEHFPVRPIACGFAWKPMTGLDNVTWWLLEKLDAVPDRQASTTMEAKAGQTSA